MAIRTGDILELAKADEPEKPFKVVVESEHYGIVELAQVEPPARMGTGTLNGNLIYLGQTYYVIQKVRKAEGQPLLQDEQFQAAVRKSWFAGGGYVIRQEPSELAESA